MLLVLTKPAYRSSSSSSCRTVSCRAVRVFGAYGSCSGSQWRNPTRQRFDLLQWKWDSDFICSGHTHCKCSVDNVENTGSACQLVGLLYLLLACMHCSSS